MSIGVNHHAKEIHHVHAKGIHFMVKQEACEISFCTIFGSRWRGLVLGKRDRLYGLLQGLSFVQQGTLEQAPALVAGFKDLAVMRNAVQ